MPAPDVLHQLIRDDLEARSHRADPDVARLIYAIEARHSGVAAVLLYGSYLRGKRDTLLDFYVLLDELRPALPVLQAAGNRLLPPNVYYLSLPASRSQAAVRAKYATMTMAQFEAAMGDFHSYFWSRFTQPAGLAAVRDDASAARVTDALCRAVDSFVRRTLPLLEAPFPAATLWNQGFLATYGCELRAERPDRIDALYAQHRRHFDALLAAYAARPDSALRLRQNGAFEPLTAIPVAAARREWALRRLQGKVLSVLRLVKAAATFNDPLDYLLWKIERHSGVYITPSERQRRHPLIFAWPLLWRLYRRGAFR